MNTLIQSVVLAAIVGPVIWVIQGGSLLWCCAGMFFAPILVDALRPVVTYYPNGVPKHIK